MSYWDNFKRDCFFYSEYKEHPASIPTCNYDGTIGYCPCADCRLFISYDEAEDIVKNYVDARLKKRRLRNDT